MNMNTCEDTYENTMEMNNVEGAYDTVMDINHVEAEMHVNTNQTDYMKKRTVIIIFMILIVIFVGACVGVFFVAKVTAENTDNVTVLPNVAATETVSTVTPDSTQDNNETASTVTPASTQVINGKHDNLAVTEPVSKVTPDSTQVINGVRFLIKHKTSWTFWHPRETRTDDPGNNSPIITYHGHHSRNVWEFVHFENEWGYIRHAVSGKFIHPYKGKLNSPNFTPLVVYNGFKPACLFALDAHRDLVIHKGGKYAYPGGESDKNKHIETSPPNLTLITLQDILNNGTKWLFVNPDNPYEEVKIYGKPTMTGYWKNIFTVPNPRLNRTEHILIMIGGKNTTETTTSFKYTWEVNANCSIDAFNFGGKISVKKMFSTTTRETWTKQTTEKKVISVTAGGPSVVVWQYVFVLEQNSRRIEYNSNIMVDTDSLKRKPDIDVPTTGVYLCKCDSGV